MMYHRTKRAKSLIVFHFIFVVKYRKSLLVEYGPRMKKIFTVIAEKSDFSIKQMEVDRDHVHVLVSNFP